MGIVSEEECSFFERAGVERGWCLVVCGRGDPEQQLSCQLEPAGRVLQKFPGTQERG